MPRCKEFFEEIRASRAEIELLTRRREKYLEMATNISANLSGLRTTPSNGSKIEAAAVALADLGDQLAEKAEAYARKVQRAEGIISRISKPRYRQILAMRYIEGCSWSEIGDALGYTEQKSVFRAHGRALQNAEKFLQDGT